MAEKRELPLGSDDATCAHAQSAGAIAVEHLSSENYLTGCAVAAYEAFAAEMLASGRWGQPESEARAAAGFKLRRRPRLRRPG